MPVTIRQRAKIAVGRRRELRPYVLTKPLTLEVSLKHYRPVELLGYLRDVQRVDPHTIRYLAKDMLEVSRFLGFVTNHDPALTP